MLYRNGELINEKHPLWKEKILKELEPFFINGEFVPLELRFLNEYSIPTKIRRHQSEIKTVNYPNGLVINMTQFLNTVNGVESWTYAERVEKINNVDTYFPRTFEFRNGIIVNNIELAYMLVIVSKCSYHNKDKNSKKFYYVYQPEKQAEKIVNIKNNTSKILKYLYDDETRLNDKDLREIANAMFIENASVKDINILRLELERHLKHSKNLHIFERFIKDKGEEFGNRTMINKAIQYNVIGFDNNKRKWFWIESDGSKLNVVYNRIIEDTEDKFEILLDFVSKNEDIRNRMMELINTKEEPVITENKKKPINVKT